MRSGVRIEHMNHLTAQHFVRRAWRWSVLLAAIFLVAGGRAGAAESGRFLLVFETSPGLKKNLPLVEQTLDGLFSSNLQHEMRENDDLAVWTVDQALQPGTFPLANWSPDDAQVYSARLKDFLEHQKFTRHASLAALQPLLNRVVKSSERLTVLIFCDGQSQLAGTPYDSGVNEFLKKKPADGKVRPAMCILVLRSYRGEYLGCSVNRSEPLDFPKFPPPPKPEPPMVKPAPIIAPTVVAPAIVPAAPVPALIIIGTKVGTNPSALTELASQPKVQPATNPPATSPAIVSNPPPPATPAPATDSIIQKISTPEPPPPAAPAVAAPTNPPIAMSSPANLPTASNSTAAATPAVDTSSDTGFQRLILIGCGLLVAALGLVVWLATRSRRPRGSLITSSMQDDPRLPPRK
jgi:hypothetical protein